MGVWDSDCSLELGLSSHDTYLAIVLFVWLDVIDGHPYRIASNPQQYWRNPDYNTLRMKLAFAVANIFGLSFVGFGEYGTVSSGSLSTNWYVTARLFRALTFA